MAETVASDQRTITKAELRELNPQGEEAGKRVTVQFNPETLKVSFANQVVPPANNAPQATDQRGTAAIQYVGKGTTKLSVQLWFDVTSVLPEALQTVDNEAVTDVRQLTKQIAYFITPKPAADDPAKDIPPGVRFLWGTFQFDGIMDSMEESLEFFSADGKPLRAGVSIGLSQQRIEFAFAAPKAGAPPPGAGGAAPGTKPLTQAPAGATLQGLAAAQGKAASWQAIGEANGIENPRLLSPGQLIDMNVNVAVRPRIGVG